MRMFLYKDDEFGAAANTRSVADMVLILNTAYYGRSLPKAVKVRMHWEVMLASGLAIETSRGHAWVCPSGTSW